MRLTQIKLAGFKSFVDPTMVAVPSRLVGVVGPNGCGKSNIIDAVRWVLGESKASELRGESMQDVIFNGSAQRKPAARASVELVFDNTDGRASGQWHAYAEISVRRVLTRDGTSSYFINNQQVRRRDIHDIFLGTGLGTRGYAIIGQGMISRIIEARPDELRVFLEEAAGVSRYKERRRETENRLSDTRDNLLRVEDIQRELAGQLERLEGQAEVAKQYRALQAEGERKQHLLWVLRHADAIEDRQRQQLEITRVQRDQDELLASIRETEAEVELARERHAEASDRVNALQVDLYQAAAEVSRLEAEIRYVVDSRQRIRNQHQQLSQSREHWQAELQRADEMEQQASASGEELAIRAEELAVRLDDASIRLPEHEAQLAQARHQLDEARRQVGAIEQQLALQAQAQRDADRQRQQWITRRERLQAERSGMALPQTEDIEARRLELQDGREQAAEFGAQLDAAEADLQQARERRQQAADALGKDRAALTRTEARLAALSRLQEQVRDKDSLLPWLREQGLDTRRRLWQRLRVQAGWEAAVEMVLRERLAAIEVSRLDLAAGFATTPPPVRFALHDLPTNVAEPSATLPWPTLASLVSTDEHALRPLLDQWLGACFAMGELGEAISRRDSLPPGACFVLPSGHRVDRHAVSFHAADGDQSGMLARAQEIQALQREQRAQQMLVEEAEQALGREQRLLDSLEPQVPALRRRLAELTTRLHAQEVALSRLEEQAEQGRQRSAAIHAELEELDALEAEALARSEQAMTAFEELDTALGARQEAAETCQLAVEAASRQLDASRDQLRDLERQVQATEFERRALAGRTEEAQRLRGSSQAQLMALESQLERLEQELAVLDDEAARAGLEDALARRTQLEEQMADRRAAQEACAVALRECDERRLLLVRQQDPLRERLTEVQLRLQAAELQAVQYEEQLKLSGLDEAAARALRESTPPEWHRAGWLQNEVQRLNQAVLALGAVNLAALEELETARERKGFLDAQQADLNAAITTLEDAIRRIDRETRALLSQTFDTVNGHFGELFPMLFGGGEARLVMTGDEILDAGVQVMAQPPGKRNSTIHLLSGGEKALTATALVFALFRLNPAPFCLLDEVDAPLDDANTERYANMVKRMSEHTQFLFISHNKIAMEMAHQLIGVTMQEQGVSRIVAVDIESALQLTTEKS